MALIQVSNITKTYTMGDVQVHALAGVSFAIDPGDYCSIMGASGSGKSTLMNIIGCLDRPTTGQYHLDKVEVDQLSDDELAHIRNRKIGFVFQQFHLLPQLTALDNVMLPMVYGGVAYGERQQRAEEALVKVGLGDRLQNQPRQLSGGQQQRVAIARAIVNQPVLLLADEPTGALDTQTTEEILHIFEQLNASGMTVIMVTHEVEVARNTRRIIWFRDGQILHQNLDAQQLHAVVAAT
ncbi:ABC transporter ATP-binding protein [Leptolyngbyaceae cyanobacterium CCMR0082]|uniref:ABC transporter ATP-binding protein n=1 Tax=Adonisia turfae CCMR0082 TaxID=2304604 RepID=A0A6M0S405_9CYAN|nr:ABC transporter ATP-binding protein [Adonisia turfae]NEZ62701.1 ABC transporter ATP-binding protein [Adonisia turfae CCMR0082]